MAFFNKIKEAFDGGGIKVKLELPKTFTWGDPSVPATVTLTGHKSERRRVEALRFSFEDVATQKSESGSGTGLSIGSGSGSGSGSGVGSENQDGQHVRIQHRHEGPIDLEPGQVVTVTVDIPVEAPETPEVEVPGFLGKVINSVGKIGRPDLITYFVMSVSTDVEGVKRAKSSSKRILNSASQGFRASTKVFGVDL